MIEAGLASLNKAARSGPKNATRQGSQFAIKNVSVGTFFSHLVEFIIAVASAWKTLVASAIFFAASFPKNILSSERQDQIDKFISPETRRKGLVWISGLFLLFACFQAWESEHQARLATEAQIEQRQEHLAMKELLGTAIIEGEALINSHKLSKEQTDADAYQHEGNRWATKTGRLIEDAYGKGEAAVWQNDAGLTGMVDPNHPTVLVTSGVINRLHRINELMVRVDSLPLLPGFDPKNYHWRTDCPEC
jgi:hypothetical protein